MSDDYFEITLKEVGSRKTAVINQISAIISDYWDWFQANNRKILEERNAGLTDKLQATIAPVIEKRFRSKKKVTALPGNSACQMPSIDPVNTYYVLWKQFDNNSYRRKNPRTSSHIKVAKPENTIAVVGKKCSWEYDKFVETEKQLAPLRQLLSAIHTTEVTLITEQRKYVRRYHQQKEA